MKEWLIGVACAVLYLIVAGVAGATYRQRNPNVDCEALYPDRLTVVAEHISYEKCDYDNSDAGFFAFCAGAGWPIYLPVIAGKELASW